MLSELFVSKKPNAVMLLEANGINLTIESPLSKMPTIIEKVLPDLYPSFLNSKNSAGLVRVGEDSFILTRTGNKVKIQYMED